MSHEGCSGSFENGQMVADKVRQMGFDQHFMPMPLTIDCSNCNHQFEMERYESQCPKCGMVYAVTPCHAFDPSQVQSAGIGY